MFLALAFGISWAAYGLSSFFEWSDAVGEALDLTVKFGPSLGGLIAALVLSGRTGAIDLLRRLFRGSPAWLLLALLLPIVVIQVALAIRAVVGGAMGPVAMGVGEATLVFLSLLATRFFLGGGLGEELGWRGIMLPALQRHMSPLRASVWVGVAWGLWHLPAYGAAIVVFVPFSIALSVVFTLFYNRTGGSLLVVALLHASVNASLSAMEEILPALDDELLVQLLALLVWGVMGAWVARRMTAVSSVAPAEGV